MKKTAVLIQARLTSSRLPGKILKPIGPLPALAHTYERLVRAGLPIIVAVPEGQAKEIRVALCEALPHRQDQIIIREGPEEDVLARYAGIAMEHQLTTVVRITGDSPFIDASMVWLCAYRAAQGNCYVSNCWPTRTEPRGLDVEAFPIQALIDADVRASAPYDREHVTPWIQRSSTLSCEQTLPSTNRPDLRWVLDTQEDYDWFCKIADSINCTAPHPTTRELLAFLKQHPEMERKENAARVR